MRGSPPSLISPAVCVVNTQQRGGPLLTKQTQWEFYFYGDLNLERENVFWDIISLRFFFFFFFSVLYFMCTHACAGFKYIVKRSLLLKVQQLTFYSRVHCGGSLKGETATIYFFYLFIFLSYLQSRFFLLFKRFIFMKKNK